MPDRDILQSATLIITLCGVWFWFRMLRRDKSQMWSVIPILSVQLHVVVFYIFILYIFPPTPGVTLYTYWSAALRMHAAIILTALAWLRWRSGGWNMTG